MAQLSAPGLAGVREFGEAELDGGRIVPYLVRELVSGPTLDERLTRGPLPAGEALRLVAEVAAALAVAHRGGVAHGHLVPGNIVLGPDRVKVTDAGLWPLRPVPAGGPGPGRARLRGPGTHARAGHPGRGHVRAGRGLRGLPGRNRVGRAACPAGAGLGRDRGW